MHPHEPFWTEESWRYAMECRRMARLVRHAERKTGLWIGIAARMRHGDALKQIRALFMSPPVPRPQFVARSQPYR